jgi:methanol metabolism-related c-type cytochrome
MASRAMTTDGDGNRGNVLKTGFYAAVITFLVFAFLCAKVFADGSGDPAAVKEVNGEYYDKDGNPTFKVKPDGTVDWYTFSGYLRYNANCIVCHGPDGSGSSYAPDLTNSLKTISYGEFLSIVAQGRKNVSASTDYVMPAFGQNKNVTCYIDDIYAYLRARSDGAVGRGRPEKHEPKPAAWTQAENNCMGPA